jgi:hypothetical protein
VVGKAAYEASQLDMSRLHGYAKRVARETRKPARDAVRERLTKQETYVETESYGILGMRTRQVSKTRTVEAGWKTIVDEHWVLHATYHNIDKHEPWGHSEYHEDTYWVLLKNGSLQKYTKWFEERTLAPLREDGHALYEMTADDIVRLDYQDRYVERGRSDRGTHTYGNREAGQLLRHAKGVGLSMALKALLS